MMNFKKVFVKTAIIGCVIYAMDQRMAYAIPGFNTQGTEDIKSNNTVSMDPQSSQQNNRVGLNYNARNVLNDFSRPGDKTSNQEAMDGKNFDTKFGLGKTGENVINQYPVYGAHSNKNLSLILTNIYTPTNSRLNEKSSNQSFKNYETDGSTEKSDSDSTATDNEINELIFSTPTNDSNNKKFLEDSRNTVEEIMNSSKDLSYSVNTNSTQSVAREDTNSDKRFSIETNSVCSSSSSESNVEKIYPETKINDGSYIRNNILNKKTTSERPSKSADITKTDDPVKLPPHNSDTCPRIQSTIVNFGEKSEYSEKRILKPNTSNVEKSWNSRGDNNKSPTPESINSMYRINEEKQTGQKPPKPTNPKPIKTTNSRNVELKRIYTRMPASQNMKNMDKTTKLKGVDPLIRAIKDNDYSKFCEEVSSRNTNQCICENNDKNRPLLILALENFENVYAGYCKIANKGTSEDMIPQNVKTSLGYAVDILKKLSIKKASIGTVPLIVIKKVIDMQNDFVHKLILGENGPITWNENIFFEGLQYAYDKQNFNATTLILHRLIENENWHKKRPGLKFFSKKSSIEKLIKSLFGFCLKQANPGKDCEQFVLAALSDKRVMECLGKELVCKALNSFKEDFGGGYIKLRDILAIFISATNSDISKNFLIDILNPGKLETKKKDIIDSNDKKIIVDKVQYVHAKDLLEKSLKTKIPHTKSARLYKQRLEQIKIAFDIVERNKRLFYFDPQAPYVTITESKKQRANVAKIAPEIAVSINNNTSRNVKNAIAKAAPAEAKKQKMYFVDSETQTKPNVPSRDKKPKKLTYVTNGLIDMPHAHNSSDQTTQTDYENPDQNMECIKMIAQENNELLQRIAKNNALFVRLDTNEKLAPKVPNRSKKPINHKTEHLEISIQNHSQNSSAQQIWGMIPFSPKEYYAENLRRLLRENPRIINQTNETTGVTLIQMAARSGNAAAIRVLDMPATTYNSTDILARAFQSRSPSTIWTCLKMVTWRGIRRLFNRNRDGINAPLLGQN